MKRRILFTLLASCLAVGPAPGPQAQTGETAELFVRAVTDYRAGRYAAALAAFREVAQVAGEQASPELLGNLALSALRERRAAESEVAARRLCELADARERSLGRFLLAQAAFERARLAEMAARLPDAEPGVWQTAVDAADRAMRQWLLAAGERGSWAAALRNAERAAEKLAELRAERDAARQDSKTEQVSPDPPPTSAQTETEERLAELVVRPLSAAELERLRERLQQKEREKRALRRTVYRSLQVGERDW